jgi:hypothetical protein
MKAKSLNKESSAWRKISDLIHWKRLYVNEVHNFTNQFVDIVARCVLQMSSVNRNIDLASDGLRAKGPYLEQHYHTEKLKATRISHNYFFRVRVT